MNTMKTSSRYMLAIIVLMDCFGSIGSYENSVHLLPNPAAVEEGESLKLHCSHTLSAPNFINWYLNNDTYGLVIEAKKCSYQATSTLYETDRYTISCYNTTCHLTIANISKSKDDGTIWKCDITVVGMNRPNKATTTIIVKERDTNDGMGPRGGEPSIVFAIPIVLVAIIILLVPAVIGYRIYRKKTTDRKIDNSR